MHTQDLSRWQHGHTFGHDQVKPGERRTLLVVIITALMMVVEVVAGILYGSMALLADGLHMASHAVALGISVMAYVFARRLATDRRFAFGTGKINSLAGFSSALLLGGFAVVMVVESTERLVNPVAIAFDYALIVAVAGLVVNGICALLLAKTPHQHEGHHAHEHHHDHNLRGAYLHVLADALTSLLAIVALLAGKYYGAHWLDPLMGVLGAILVARWSYTLMKDSAQVLLDRQADQEVIGKLKRSLERKTNDRVSDLHVWSIGHGIHAAEITVVSDEPKTPDQYKSLIPGDLNIVHAAIEVHQCPSSPHG